jgi:hypothetical protein
MGTQTLSKVPHDDSGGSGNCWPVWVTVRRPMMAVVFFFGDPNVRLFNAMTSVYAAQVVEKLYADGRAAVIRQ